ncbi:MAG: GNAT family N-acetyltransferase [Bacteroidetes bacterium]|nr:GNAT family N-acetyltransferase [Bacteroidota bacterium]
MNVLLMRKTLDTPLPAPSWPQDIHLTTLTPDTSHQVHDLIALSYQNGGGSVAPCTEWWSSLTTDFEFDATLCFLAWDPQGLVGVAQCWTSAFIKDLAVHPRRRKQGIGQALLLHTFSTFQKRGAKSVDLKVEATNAAAIALYTKVGMVKSAIF